MKSDLLDITFHKQYIHLQKQKLNNGVSYESKAVFDYY